MSTPQPAPAMVFDSTAEDAWRIYAPDYHPRFLAWIRSHGLNPHDIYRIEIHLLNGPVARIYEYARDGNGRGYCPIEHDHRGEDAACDIARREPYDVILTSLPPTPMEGMMEP